MKKIFLSLLIFLFASFLLVGCIDDNPDNSEVPDDGDVDVDNNYEGDPVGFTIHYKRNDASYDTWGLWLWEDGGEGAVYPFQGTDSYGAYVTYDFTEWSEGLAEGKLGFIVRKQASWVKDYESDRFITFSNFKLDNSGYYQIYLREGDGTIYTNAAGEVADIIQTFEIIRKNNNFFVWFELNKPYSNYKMYFDGVEIASSETHDTNPNVVIKATKKVEYKLGADIPDVTKEFKLDVVFKESKLSQTKFADKSKLYKTAAFAEAYTYNGDLGALYDPNETVFRVWSPISSEMKLRIYNTGTPEKVMLDGKQTLLPNGSNEFQEYKMERIENGAWEYTVKGDLSGKYYTYVVTNSAYQNREVVDPYAKSTGINGYRGMVVDFSKTNPEGWNDIKIKEIPVQGLTIYETHVADITSSTTWGGSNENSKLFKGLYEEGTSYTENGITVSTGFDHIKELGVNAVQLIPIFDQANDERPDDDPTRVNSTRKFNWGYNPLNYNALDGIYSSDPYDGYAKIKEFKELVKAYNEAGINIIMDVVYNHVSGLDGSNFDVLMPKYYFRYNNGVASNGSGCGNETASEMSMFRKFMIDSTEFWAKEYKLGGFRFDLMGVHDVETMNQLTKNLHDNVNEYIAVFGEPWTGGTIALSGTAANQANVNRYQGYGQFNDKMRDSLIKGGLNGDSSKGWVNNGSVNTGDVNALVNGFKGITLAKETDPTKSISYVTCHDNYTLYDRLKAAGDNDPVKIKKMAMLANSCVFTSQGISFMLAGEEMLRTKGGDHNSYESSYKVNEIDYSLKIKHLDMFENYKKLIALKQNINLFGKTAAEIVTDVTIDVQGNGELIVMKVQDKQNKMEYVICHTNSFATGLKKVDLSGYTLYLDTLNKQDLTLTSETIISNYQTIIAYKTIE